MDKEKDFQDGQGLVGYVKDHDQGYMDSTCTDYQGKDQGDKKRRSFHWRVKDLLENKWHIFKWV